MKKAVLFSLALVLATTGLVFLWGCSSDDNPTGLTGTGSVSVYPLPGNAADFPWNLVGPNGYSRDGAGPETIADLAAGDYTVTWGSIAAWVTPSPATQTKTLTGGSTINFQASYQSTGGQASAGQVIIDPRPNDVGIDFPWSITGPLSFSEAGAGYRQFEDMEPGDYVLTWGEYDGWNTPVPMEETQTLVEGEGISFQAEFVEQGGSSVEMIDITAGTFLMGSERSEDGARAYEWPRHRVTLTGDYQISRTEITWDQWLSVMPTNPSYYFGICGQCEGTYPVENVEWIDAVAFCNALSDREGLEQAYTIVGEDVTWNRSANGFRLPTEAEWEYACRAGTTTSLPNGDLSYVAASCYGDAYLDEIGWYCDNADQRPHPVAGLASNPWGVNDMNGNVWEWVWDWSDYYDSLTMIMGDFEFDDGTVEELGTGSIIQALAGFGDGLLLRLDQVTADLGIGNLGIVTESVSFAYADFDGQVNLQVNDATLYKGPLSSMPTDVAPGVTLSVTESPVSDDIFGDGTQGMVTLTGDVSGLVIGGFSLMIDDIEIVDSAASSFTLDRMADFNIQVLGLTFRPNPGGAPVVNSLSCTVTDPIGPPSGGTHMLRGGGYMNAPGYCRSASRSEPNRGIYSGFRVVRNAD